MNWSIFKSLAFWVTALPVLFGLLSTSGAILSGSAVDHVVGVIIALLGVLGGHQLASPVAPAPAA